MQCGEVAWITCGTWIQLWSGSIGAFVAAIIGGLVALVVVRLTNGQQRRQAQLSREIDAIADFIAQCSSFNLRVDTDSEFDHFNELAKLDAAQVRLRLASPDLIPIANATKLWPVTMATLAVAYQRAKLHEDPMAKEISHVMNNAANAAFVCLGDWGDVKARPAMVGFLQEPTKLLTECKEKMFLEKPTHDDDAQEPPQSPAPSGSGMDS